ncbi:hypothetical protein DXT99_08605 [Pontibacter diazotrophicus]|uniref:Glycosyltransferase RgtA/B/C/D-like domain-containing protein n=1 Tax=Pontibacter diazotrophicus TaxID=1400979 RepID=A0A3D8LDK0_9BACT|nr:DUF6056 family protein [Pontibacter diazotrophicus]RDV15539.1 hypothetical protein DXT99_08605 [Pontibacter diazotrophicus]
MPIGLGVAKRQYTIILVLVGFYTLLPFLILTAYVHPSYDDYQIALRDGVGGFWETQADIYFNWSGRYFATAISRINPLIYWPLSVYNLYAAALLVLLTGAFYFLIRAVCKKYFSELEIAAICSVILAVYFVQMPDIAQGIYWFSGYMTYQFANILTLLLLLCLYQFFHVTGRLFKMIYILLSAVLATAVIGSNEMSLVGVMVLLTFILFTSWNKSFTNRPYLFFLFVICVAASLTAVLAPGNYARMPTQNNPANLVLSVTGALGLTAIAFYKWGAVVVAASLLYALLWGIPIASKAKNSIFFEVNFSVAIISYVASVTLMYFVFAWATGDRAGTRVEIVIYFFFVLGWFYNLQLLLNRYFKEKPVTETTLSKLLPAPLLFLLLLSLTNINSNITTAYLDLISGNAQVFDEELNRRYSYIYHSSCSSCSVPALSVLPKSLYILHMLPKSESEEMGVNDSFAAYWGKQHVELEGPVPDIKDNIEIVKDIGKGLRNRLLD